MILVYLFRLRTPSSLLLKGEQIGFDQIINNCTHIVLIRKINERGIVR